MGWKRSTTYTLLKRMIEKEAAENTNTMVTMKLSKEEVDRENAEDLIQKSYQGSLPMFIAAYTKGRKLSEEEAAELKILIRRSEGR
jgi:predicted transcriptional regulator